MISDNVPECFLLDIKHVTKIILFGVILIILVVTLIVLGITLIAFALCV